MYCGSGIWLWSLTLSMSSLNFPPVFSISGTMTLSVCTELQARNWLRKTKITGPRQEDIIFIEKNYPPLFVFQQIMKFL